MNVTFAMIIITLSVVTHSLLSKLICLIIIKKTAISITDKYTKKKEKQSVKKESKNKIMKIKRKFKSASHRSEQDFIRFRRRNKTTKNKHRPNTSEFPRVRTPHFRQIVYCLFRFQVSAATHTLTASGK